MQTRRKTTRPSGALARRAGFTAVTLLAGMLSGCDDPHVYGSIGVSSGYSSYGGYYGSRPRVGGSITIGGRIR